MTTQALQEILEDWTDADQEERMEMLLDFARGLPQLPERYEPMRDAEHRIDECQSPVFFFAEVDPDRHAHLFADVPMEAPTVRGFVALLIEGLDGASFDEILQVPNDLVMRMKLQDMLGLLRVRGLNAVLHRVKAEVTRAAIDTPATDAK